MAEKCTNCVLVAAGKYHDIDFARGELLKLLALDANVRTRVFEDFENIDALQQSDVLITYTCDVVPSVVAQHALNEWLQRGGRWLALHGTNSVLELLDDGQWHTPDVAPDFMQMLGSRFISHPPIAPYLVENVAPQHPIVAGIPDFEVSDELYHLEIYEPIERLLECECTEVGRGFVEGEAALGRHPVLYRKRHQLGDVLYFTLGHCRGHHDMQPLKDYWPTVERGAWEIPEYREILHRSIEWLLSPNE